MLNARAGALGDDAVQSVIARLRDGAALIDARDRAILGANDAFVALLGYGLEELRALPSLFSLTAPDESAARDQLAYRRARVTGRLELSLARKSGEVVYTDVSLSPLEAGVDLAIFRDMTARKRHEDALLRVSDALEQGIQERSDELEAANRALAEAVRVRDEFLAIASHELRTPLTPLLLRLQRLGRVARAASESVYANVKDEVDGTLRQVNRLIRLVDQILDVSRLHGERAAIARVPLDLVPLVREVLDRAREDAARARCTLSLEADERVEGSWDPVRVEQVVTNLVANAIKYGAGKPVHISVAWRESRAVLTVQDGGIGISEQDQRRIFQRFERAVSMSHYGGFGLGLWIARHAVDAHGGTISVASAPGEGSTFVVELPRG